MTTNIDRAAAIIERFLPPLPGRLGVIQAEKTARALDKDGLLLPDGAAVQSETVTPNSLTTGSGRGDVDALDQACLESDTVLATPGLVSSLPATTFAPHAPH